MTTHSIELETHIENFENGLTAHKEPCRCQTCVDERNNIRTTVAQEAREEEREALLMKIARIPKMGFKMSDVMEAITNEANTPNQ